MASKLSQDLRQTQGLMMTPQLQQAIKMLTLTHLELTKLIADELVENPLLEEDYGSTPQGKYLAEVDQKIQLLEKENVEYHPQTTAGKEQAPLEGPKDDFDWDQYMDPFNTTSSSPPASSTIQSHSSQNDEEDGFNYENIVTREQNIFEYLEWQIRMQNLAPLQLQLAYEIIHNLGADGYLEVPFTEICQNSPLDQSMANEVLSMVQNLDPVGCGASSLKECLLIQAKTLSPRLPLVEKILEDHLQEIDKKDYLNLSKKLGVSKELIKRAIEVIAQFNPRPGGQIYSEQTQYIVPDIYVYEVGGEFVIALNDEGVPKLKVSGLYQNIIKGEQKKKKMPNSEENEYIHDKYKSALWMIKSIQNRHKTIIKVVEAIVRYQPEFFRKGPECLRPMILRDIAQEIGMHESTVSRVTVNKYMHTPLGVFELKYFFNSGIGGKNGGVDIAGETLKLKIKGLIEKENPKRPLSDQKIVEILDKDGVVVARRTVAKYREMMGIDPSAQRKR